jgi:holo-[acyl-carrier protein] synthase
MNLKEFFVGVDIEEVRRFRKKSPLFYNKIFTSGEKKYCMSKIKPEQHFAVRFCAKEAFIKALSGFGYRDITFKEIDIYHDKNGCPAIRFDKVRGLISKVSLSHNDKNAIEYVVVSKK